MTSRGALESETVKPLLFRMIILSSTVSMVYLLKLCFITSVTHAWLPFKKYVANMFPCLYAIDRNGVLRFILITMIMIIILIIITIISLIFLLGLHKVSQKKSLLLRENCGASGWSLSHARGKET